MNTLILATANQKPCDPDLGFIIFLAVCMYAGIIIFSYHAMWSGFKVEYNRETKKKNYKLKELPDFDCLEDKLYFKYRYVAMYTFWFTAGLGASTIIFALINHLN